MKKGFLRCAAIAMLMVFVSVGSVFAAEEAGKNFIANKVGVGYQGMVAGSFLNGISVRGWINDKIGLEGTGFYGKIDADVEVGGYGTSGMKADLWMIEAKAMYAFIVRNYSKFYVGGKIGYGQIGMTDSPMDGTSFYVPGVFVGSEFSFPQLPEVGFNFDVGYQWLRYDNNISYDDTEYMFMDLDMTGVNVTFGIHYYF